MLLYKSLVRPVIEYAAPAWNPYVAKDVLALERIQRKPVGLLSGKNVVRWNTKIEVAYTRNT